MAPPRNLLRSSISEASGAWPTSEQSKGRLKHHEVLCIILYRTQRKASKSKQISNAAVRLSGCPTNRCSLVHTLHACLSYYLVPRQKNDSITAAWRAVCSFIIRWDRIACVVRCSVVPPLAVVGSSSNSRIPGQR